MKKLLLVVVALIVLLVVFVVARSATPVVTLPASITTIGQATPVSVQVHDPRGVRSVRAMVEQNGVRYPVFSSNEKQKPA